MAVSASLHRNVLLLTQVIQPNDEFKKLFREGMFDKPNTAGFLHVSRYLLMIYDSERFKKLVVWPVICKKTEAQYRSNVKDYLTIVATENPDISFPNILMSHLLHAGGSKFTTIMWKLSQVVTRTYIARETTSGVMLAPQAGAGGNLAKIFLQNANARMSSDIQNRHRNILAMEEAAKSVLEKETAIQAKTRTEIFETEQSISDLASSAPVHPSIQKRLMDVGDAEVIEMWKKHINKYVNYLQTQNAVLMELEQLSSKVKEVVANSSSEAKMLDGKQLKRIEPSEVSEFFPPKDQCFLFQLYKNDNLVLNNFIILFHSLLQQLLQRLKLYPPQDFSKCLSQIEASCNDMKSILNCLQTFSSNIAKTSSELEEVLCTEKMIQSYNDNGMSMSNNLLLIPSPLIKIDTNYIDEKNELQKRLQFTPVEAAHKSLFSRYERQNQTPLRGSKPKANFFISRINFDDTMSTTNDDKQSVNTHLSTPKRNLSLTRHAGKYSRLFSTRPKRYNATANSSTMSMPCFAKANSTAITNAIEEFHDTSILDMGITEKNISIAEKFITPQKSFLQEVTTSENTPPQKLPLKELITPESTSQKLLLQEPVKSEHTFPKLPVQEEVKSEDTCQKLPVKEEVKSEDTSEIEDVVNALPSKPGIPGIGEKIDTESNYDNAIVKTEQNASRRRSIGDLVERYKRLIEVSSRKNSPVNCTAQEN